MLYSLSRSRSIENAHRFIPVLKKWCRTVESGPWETTLVRSHPDEQIQKFRLGKTYKKNFIENFFLGIFEPDALEYPQIRTKIEVDHLYEHGKRVKNLMLHGINYKEIESNGKITKETYSRLQEVDLVGMKIKLEDEGLGYFQSESSYVQESIYLNSSLGKIVADSENSGYQLLQLFGTDSQKHEYLPKFLKGECISCLAHLENRSWVSQGSSIDTTAVQEADGRFVISGRKTLVYNPNCADILIVSARINNLKENDSYTLFMVDKNSKGLSVLAPLDKYSLNGTEICDVVFNKVVVSGDKVLGKINEGREIIDKLISQGKLSNGAQCIGIMRKLVNDAITHCIHNNCFNKPLHKYKYIQGKIGELVNALYAAESMTYLMNGRIDQDPNLDAKLESLIVKIFNSEALNFILYNYMHLVGKDKCNEKFIETLIGDSLYFIAFDDQNLYLKAMLGTTGVKYTLKHMSNQSQRVEQYKPMSRMTLKYYKHISTKTTLGKNKILPGYLHLTLEMESKILNHCVKTLNLMTELLINAYGNEAIIKPYFLCQLADLSIITYKLTAVLGRASRAYCIGLRNSDEEIRIARNIAQNSYQRATTINWNLLEFLKNERTPENVANYVSTCGKLSNLHPAKPFQKGMSAS